MKLLLLLSHFYIQTQITHARISYLLHNTLFRNECRDVMIASKLTVVKCAGDWGFFSFCLLKKRVFSLAAITKPTNTDYQIQLILQK